MTFNQHTLLDTPHGGQERLEGKRTRSLLVIKKEIYNHAVDALSHPTQETSNEGTLYIPTVRWEFTMKVNYCDSIAMAIKWVP